LTREHKRIYSFASPSKDRGTQTKGHNNTCESKRTSLKQNPTSYICIMESMRQQKIGRQIQKDLGDIFLRHGRDYFGSSMVTITEINVTPDLAIASVYLSVFPNENTDQFFEKLESKKNEIRKRLGNQMKKRARIIPELNFFHDETTEHASRMDKLIDGLNIPPADDSEK